MCIYTAHIMTFIFEGDGGDGGDGDGDGDGGDGLGDGMHLMCVGNFTRQSIQDPDAKHLGIC